MFLPATPHHAWFLVGATAVGKTAVAHGIALRTGAAIVSADAMLVYRGLDIGTAKPNAAERAAVPYLGIDLAAPSEPFSVGDWLVAVRRGLQELAPSRPVIVTGGTGLYVKALLAGLDVPAADPLRRAHWQEVLTRGGVAALQAALTAADPAALAALDDPQNPRRLVRALERQELSRDAAATTPRWRTLALPTVVGLRLAPALLQARIARRVQVMLDAGLTEEAARLRADGPPLSPTARGAIGYAEALELCDGRITRQAAAERIATRTRQLAKRQMTWLRHQLPVDWLDIDETEPDADVAARVLTTWRKHGPAPLADR